MHEAYEVSHLLNATVQIEAIAAYDENLFLGTRQGHLLMYSLASNNGNQKYELQLLRYCKNFSKKPIQQIEVIPEDNLLLCLTDNILSSYDINGVNFPLVKTFSESKGASLFALDNKSATSMTGESNSVVRLCVAVRRKLQLYYGKNGKFQKHLFDFTIPDVPKVMAWGPQYLCVGFKGEYTLFDLSSGKPKELFPTSSSKSQEPTIAKYSETSFLLGRNNTSVLVEEAQNIEVKNTIKWKEAPIAVVWDEPFVLGLLQDQVVVQTVEPPLFIQTLPDLNKARLMYRCKRGLMFVSSVGQVWCVSSVDVTKQRQQLLKDKQFQIAIDLTVLCALSFLATGSYQRIVGVSLHLPQRTTSRAIREVVDALESVYMTQKYIQFPQTHQERSRIRQEFQRRFNLPGVVGCIDCTHISLVRPSEEEHLFFNRKGYHSLNVQMNLSDFAPEEKKQSIRSIQKLFAIELFHSKAYSQSMKEFMKINADLDFVIKLFPEIDNKPGTESKKTKGEGSENPLNALIEYLLEYRSKLGKNDTDAGSSNQEQNQKNIAQQLELIDTTLLKCYLQTNDALVASLLRLNNCRLDEAESTLRAHGKHSELIILYQTKGQHTQALQLLREESTQQDSSLKGFHMTKNYLQHLGAEHLHLIFKFSDWILEEHPEEGLKIFTEDIVEVENLPRAKVLDFLLREHESLVIPYLEHVIHTWNDTNSEFHNVLIHMYRKKIIDKKANATEEELQHIKSKLVSFLEKSSHYISERVILHFPNDSLFEERAIILGKLGRHEQALSIYVQVLGDVERAIRYCEKVSDKNADVYVILIRILVNPEENSSLTGPLSNVPRHPNASAPDVETALSILEKHADKISPIKALAVLPSSVPLSRLKLFLESALESQLTLKRRTQVLKGLLYAEHLQVQEVKQFHESKKIEINDYKVCPVCKKRFGHQSAFVRFPNGDIVHYSCRGEGR